MNTHATITLRRAGGKAGGRRQDMIPCAPFRLPACPVVVA